MATTCPFPIRAAARAISAGSGYSGLTFTISAISFPEIRHRDTEARSQKSEESKSFGTEFTRGDLQSRFFAEFTLSALQSRSFAALPAATLPSTTLRAGRAGRMTSEGLRMTSEGSLRMTLLIFILDFLTPDSLSLWRH